MVLKLYDTSESSGRHLKAQIAGSHHTVSDSVDLRLGPRICISNKYPVLPTLLDIHTLVSSHLEEHCRGGFVYMLIDGIEFNRAPKHFSQTFRYSSAFK